LLMGAGGAEAREIAERVRQRVAAQPFQGARGQPLAVTVSVGVATLEARADEGRGPEALGQALVETADACLYRAKGNGRNRVEVDHVASLAPVT